VDTDAAFAGFSRVLADRGARDALAYLLGLSEYRFIGVFRFKDSKANAAIHFDRDNPDVMSANEVPGSATYCCYVRDSKGAFMTAHAIADPRLAEHAARTVVQAYCGVPIMDPEGQVLGTLCHYDLVPRDPAQLDMELLVRVASALQQGNHVPPYPQPPATP
jgi:GAF domain-containing protein